MVAFKPWNDHNVKHPNDVLLENYQCKSINNLTKSVIVIDDLRNEFLLRGEICRRGTL